MLDNIHHIMKYQIKGPKKLRYLRENIDKVTLMMLCGDWFSQMSFIDLRQCEINGGREGLLKTLDFYKR